MVSVIRWKSLRPPRCSYRAWVSRLTGQVVQQLAYTFRSGAHPGIQSALSFDIISYLYSIELLLFDPLECWRLLRLSMYLKGPNYSTKGFFMRTAPVLNIGWLYFGYHHSIKFNMRQTMWIHEHTWSECIAAQDSSSVMIWCITSPSLMSNCSASLRKMSTKAFLQLVDGRVTVKVVNTSKNSSHNSCKHSRHSSLSTILCTVLYRRNSWT